MKVVAEIVIRIVFCTIGVMTAFAVLLACMYVVGKQNFGTLVNLFVMLPLAALLAVMVEIAYVKFINVLYKIVSGTGFIK